MAYRSCIKVLWLTLTLLLILVSRARAKIPAIIVFGDSTVDTGNNNAILTVLKSNFPPYGRDFVGARPTGRFSNGRLPPDFISEAFKLKPLVPAYLDPAYNISDFATGVCFASAGTGYDNHTAGLLNVIPLWKEVEMYKEYQARLRAHVGDKQADEIISEALYLLSIGTNDFLENYYVFPTRRSHYSPQQYQDFLLGIAEDFIRKLYALGARKLATVGLPPIGCLPLERFTNALGHHHCIDKYNNVALEYNQKFKILLAKLNKELAGLKIVIVDIYDKLYQMVTQPSSFGFEVSVRACCVTGTVEMGYLCQSHHVFTCKDPNKYVFWDAFHPTEKTIKLLSDYGIPQLLSNFK